MGIIQNGVVSYSDIDLSFTTNPFTRDISTLTNEAAVKRSIRHAIFFNKFDIPFNDSEYSSIKNILFEPISYVTSALLKSAITHIINKLDSRVLINSIDVKENIQNDGYDIVISFTILYLQAQSKLEIFLQRTR